MENPQEAGRCDGDEADPTTGSYLPLAGDPKRAASDALRGYVYQIWVSVHAWLELQENDILMLEGAEDIDCLRRGETVTIQVKDVSANLTLRSSSIADAITNFWKLCATNPGRKILFRFLTTAEPGNEQGFPFGEGVKGLVLWNRAHRSQDEARKIVDFLKTLDSLPIDLRQYLTSTDISTVSTTLIQPVVWETGAGDSEFFKAEIERKLTSLGEQFGILPDESRSAMPALLQTALETACAKGPRILDRSRLREVFQEATTERIPRGELHALRSMAQDVFRMLAASGPATEAIKLRPASRVQVKPPPLPARVTPRSDLVQNDVSILRDTGFLILTGSVGMGKTTLAKLIAGVEGQWLWTSLSALEPQVAVFVLSELGTILDGNRDIKNVVLDDIDLSPSACRNYEDTLGGLLVTLRKRDGSVLITSQRDPSQRLRNALGLEPQNTQRVPPLSESEIELLLLNAGHPGPPDNLRTQAKIINLQTSGHPQLVQARVMTCKANGWPGIRLEDLVTTPTEIARARMETRQILVETLSEEQKNVLYRLSIVGMFRRDHAVEIGRQSGVSAVGDIFDSLLGPWIEPIAEDYYRVSPLLNQAANEAWARDAVIKIHADIAAALLRCGNLSIYEGQSIFMHAFIGRHAKVLFLAVNGIVTARDEIRTTMCKELSWFLAVGIESGRMIFPENPSLNAALRMLQFRIAVEVDPSKAPLIVHLWEKELLPHAPQELYLLERYMLIRQVLLHYQVPISASTLVDRLEEMDAIETALPKIRDQLSKLNIPESREFGIFHPFDSPKVFFSFIVARCQDHGFLKDLTQRLLKVPTTLRDRMLAGLRESASASMMLVDKVWLTETRAKEPRWESCINVLHEVGGAAKEMRIANLLFASARGVAIICDEYLNDPRRALDELDFVEKAHGTSPILNEERATMLYHQKDYSGALTIWEKDLAVRPPKPPDYDVSIWTCRKAGICAALIGDWLKAARLFKEGYERAVVTDIPWATAGLLADAGFAYWKAGRSGDSLHILQDALLLLERLPSAQTDFKSFSVGKLLGAVLVWIKSSLAGRERDEPAEPLPGMCSNPDPDERLKELPATLAAYCWALLAEIEYDTGLGEAVFKHVLREFERSEYVLVQVLLGTLRVRYSIRNGCFDGIPSYSFLVARSMTAGRAATEPSTSLFAKISEKELDTIMTSSDLEFVEHTMMQALICAAWTNACQGTLDKWEQEVRAHTKLQNVLNFLSTARAILSMRIDDARAKMRDGHADWRPRTLAALCLCLDDETAPEDMFQAHSFLLECVRRGICKKEGARCLADLVARNWINMTRFRAVLRMPMITVPEIIQVCGENKPGLQKVAGILLAASRAISTRIPNEVIKDLETLCQS